MLAMGSVQQMVVEAVQKGKVQFHLPAFLQSVVLEDMNTSKTTDCRKAGVAFVIT